MTLKYPQQIGNLGSDYVTFTPSKYKANFNKNDSAGAPEEGVESVVLYMPNSTPSIGNGQSWASKAMPGPLGNLKKMGAKAIGEIAHDGFSGKIDSVDALTQRIQGSIDEYSDKIGVGGSVAALGQGGMEVASGFIGLSPNQQLALAKGAVFNPNIELFYSSPGLRPFSMSFDFVPKNAVEAEMMNKIILHFKKYSSPKAKGDSGMFEIPYVWQVKYMSGKTENRNMNRFKKAAITNVQVQANANIPMHVAHLEGVPIMTTMALSFMEVDIVMREDHEKIGGQGY